MLPNDTLIISQNFQLIKILSFQLINILDISPQSVQLAPEIIAIKLLAQAGETSESDC